MRYKLALLASLLIVGSAQSAFVLTKEPIYDGRRVTVDLPASQHKRNVGGSDGAGLCVYTSVWHSAIWQSVRDIYDFRNWMQRRPGGSYPEKFDATLKAYCKEKGVPLPPYLQHTGGDEDVLDLAMKTGRAVGVTYCGVDPNYGNEVIAHMVSLVYLDAKLACILDNNFPGAFLWMPREEFLARWRGVRKDGTVYLIRSGVRSVAVGGGWCIVLLDSPPPPYSHQQPTIQFSQPPCRKGVCPLPLSESPAQWIPHTNGREWYLWQSGKCRAVCFADGRCESVNENGIATGEEIEPPLPTPVVPNRTDLPAPVGDYPRGGVESEKIRNEPQYWVSGNRCTKNQLISSLVGAGLTDDSSRWNLTVVGDTGFTNRVKADVDALPDSVKAKLHVKFYAISDWQVSQFALIEGVTLRSPATNRVGKEIGFVSVSEWTSTQLAALLALPEGPVTVVPKPTPIPVPTPVPAPNPPIDPQPTPSPVRPLTLSDVILAALVAVVGWLALRRKS